MKKFLIISAVLLLLGAGAFGFALNHYLSVMNQNAVVEATQAEESTQTATEQPTLNRASVDDKGIFSDYYAQAQKLVENLSKEQMIGQMLLGVVSDPDAAATDVNKYSLGGVLFDSESFDYKTEEEIKAALTKVNSSTKIAPVLAAQEEGGYVTTVTGHAESEHVFDSPRNIYDEGGLSAVQKVEDEKAKYLKELGFNLNMAPVLDLPDSLDQIMYSRSLSSDANTTSSFAEYAAKFNQAKGISVALKHFPGYGTIQDTDDSVVVDTRNASTIKSNDYLPFKAGSDAGAHFIMVSNVLVKGLDAQYIASLSPTVHRELRDTIGFTGIIVTDVIDRADYSDYAGGNAPAVAAVLAGNDMILVNDYSAAYKSILDAVNNGTIDPAILQQACTRILAYKYSVGLLK